MGLKVHYRNGIGRLMHISGCSALLRRLNSRSLVILCYHRVLSPSDRHSYPMSDLAVTPEAFAQQVEHCSKYYECLPLREAVDRLRSDRPSGRPLLAFTFDDGYWDNHAFARPILEDHNVRATFFVITSLVGSDTAPWYDRLAGALSHLNRASSGKSSMLVDLLPQTDLRMSDTQASGEGASLGCLMESAKRLPARKRLELVERVSKRALGCGWQPGTRDRIVDLDELSALVDEGHEVASHTRSHPILTHCSQDELITELEDSRLELSAMIGQEVTSFAYPNGDHDDRVVAAARESGYRQAVTMNGGLNHRTSDPFTLRRVFVSQERLSRRNGECSTHVLDLELAGVADTLFFRRQRGVR